MKALYPAPMICILLFGGCGNSTNNVEWDTSVEEEPYIECTSPDDCDDLPESDECQQRTCVDNLCGLSFTEEGTEVTTQVTGDCRLAVCDGAGGERADVDDTDLPDDGLECTEDLCGDGTPSNPPLEAGTPCSAGVCDGDGACVGCNEPGDCGTDTYCRAQTCESHVCGVADTAAGTALPAEDQTPNDCKIVQCDGDGAEETVEDAEDLPEDDDSDCTTEQCNGPTPEHAPLDEGTWCGAARIQPICNPDACDAAGTCVDVEPALAGTPCGYAIVDPTCNPDACDDTGLCIDSPFAPDDTPCTEHGGNMCRSGACTWVPIPPPEPTNLRGCTTCSCCDTWAIEWDPVDGATYYMVDWKCSLSIAQHWNVGLDTRVDDVCFDIDMCNGMCAMTVGWIEVRACDDDACSDPVRMPADEIPMTCGGGCCC